VDAVVREAREEAGLDGTIAPEPLTSYRYHGGQEVAAYLLDTTGRGLGKSAEPWRDPRWCDAERAKALLARRRKDDDEPVAHEHARVVDEAVRALTGG
jgi:8-oxo-dGTP pyrophosphatase MutT (NUDIX family)